MVVIGIADWINNGVKLAKFEVKKQEAKKEVIEQGTTLPSPADTIQNTKEAKAQQEIFHKAFDESLNKRTNLRPSLLGFRAPSLLRFAADCLAIEEGFFVIFKAQNKKRPSWGPDRNV